MGLLCARHKVLSDLLTSIRLFNPPTSLRGIVITRVSQVRKLKFEEIMKSRTDKSAKSHGDLCGD